MRRPARERWVHDPEVDLVARPLQPELPRCRGLAATRAPDRRRCRSGSSSRPPTRASSRWTPPTVQRCTGLRRAAARWTSRTGLGGRDPREDGISSPPIVVGDVVAGRLVGGREPTRRHAERHACRPSTRAAGRPAGAGTRCRATRPTRPAPPGAATAPIAPAPPTSGRWARPTPSATSSSCRPAAPRRTSTAASASATTAARTAWSRCAPSTGELVWSFQTVHHDLWDYDVGSQPVLIDFPVDGRLVPAVVQATKMGHLFILDRETGEPLVPVEERPVPAVRRAGRGAARRPSPSPPGRRRSSRSGCGPKTPGASPPGSRALRARRSRRCASEGVFTPPSLEGSVVYPGHRRRLELGQRRLRPGAPAALRQHLADREHGAAGARANDGPRHARPLGATSPRFEQAGHALRRALRRAALALRRARATRRPGARSRRSTSVPSGRRWERPLGTVRDLAPAAARRCPGACRTWAARSRRPGGLVFIGAALDDYLRAFDSETGEELWKGRLPGRRPGDAR